VLGGKYRVARKPTNARNETDDWRARVFRRSARAPPLYLAQQAQASRVHSATHQACVDGVSRVPPHGAPSLPHRVIAPRKHHLAIPTCCLCTAASCHRTHIRVSRTCALLPLSRLLYTCTRGQGGFAILACLTAPTSSTCHRQHLLPHICLHVCATQT